MTSIPQGHLIVRYGGGVHMLGGSSWGAFRCPSADSGFMEAPPTSRSATAHRSLALDHDKKWSCSIPGGP